MVLLVACQMFSVKCFPSSVFRQACSVKRLPSCIFRQACSVKRFPSSVFRHAFSVKRFPSTVFRQVFSVKRFPSTVFRQAVLAPIIFTFGGDKPIFFEITKTMQFVFWGAWRFRLTLTSAGWLRLCCRDRVNLRGTTKEHTATLTAAAPRLLESHWGPAVSAVLLAHTHGCVV